jgi:hypothetical protein
MNRIGGRIVSDTVKTVAIIGGTAIALFLVTRKSMPHRYYSPASVTQDQNQAALAMQIGSQFMPNMGGVNQFMGQIFGSSGNNVPTNDIEDF